MNSYTNEEIAKKVQEIWTSVSGDLLNIGTSRYGDDSGIVVTQDDDSVRITIQAMYDAPGLSYKHLKQLAEYFGTDNINDDDRFHNGGCETCDYGSSYGFTLTIRPTK